VSGNIVNAKVLYAGNTGSTTADSGIIGATVLSGIDSYGTAGAPTVYTVDSALSLNALTTYDAGANSTLKIDDSAAVSALATFQIGKAITLPGGGSVAAGNGTLEFGPGLSLPVLSTLTMYGTNDTLILDTGTSTPIRVGGLVAGDNIIFGAVAYTAGDKVVPVSGGSPLTGYSEQIQSANGTVLATIRTSTAPAGGYVTDVGGKIEFTVCFLAGTRIRTPLGEVAVESLKIGEEVVTAEGHLRPVRWVGINTVSTVFADPLRVMPIRVRAGALGDGLPLRDLLISPDHALLIDGVLIHAGALVNGLSITRESWMPESFKYYHVELADHSLILAEGAAAETFIDNVDRMAFDNWEEHQALYGDDAGLLELDYPRAKSARQVPPAIKARLMTQATAWETAQAA
jgi:hypothetical protein